VYQIKHQPSWWLWRPRFLSSVISTNGRISRVKPANIGQTWVITSKTEPTTPIDPLDQVNTPLWSTFGQRHGQTPLKTLTSASVFRNFCRVLEISTKHFKIYQYESCPVCRGTQLSCRLAFPVLSGNWWKTWSTDSSSCSLRHGGIPSWQAVPAKTIEKNTYESL
jgi:hypothetical protein